MKHNQIFCYVRNGQHHFSTNPPQFHPKSKLVQTASFQRVSGAEISEPQNAPFAEGEIINGEPFVEGVIRIYDIIPA
jgi:hypothetical protein